MIVMVTRREGSSNATFSSPGSTPSGHQYSRLFRRCGTLTLTRKERSASPSFTSQAMIVMVTRRPARDGCSLCQEVPGRTLRSFVNQFDMLLRAQHRIFMNCDKRYQNTTWLVFQTFFLTLDSCYRLVAPTSIRTFL